MKPFLSTTDFKLFSLEGYYTPLGPGHENIYDTDTFQTTRTESVDSMRASVEGIHLHKQTLLITKQLIKIIHWVL